MKLVKKEEIAIVARISGRGADSKDEEKVTGKGHQQILCYERTKRSVWPVWKNISHPGGRREF